MLSLHVVLQSFILRKRSIAYGTCKLTAGGAFVLRMTIQISFMMITSAAGYTNVRQFFKIGSRFSATPARPGR